MLFFGLLLGCQTDKRTEETEYGFSSEYGGYYVQYESTPATIPLNEEFSLEIKAYSAEDPTTQLTNITIEVDAEMPEHNHGMNQLPTVTMTDGTAIVDGMLFHMTGYWDVLVLINESSKRETVYIPVDCCE